VVKFCVKLKVNRAINLSPLQCRLARAALHFGVRDLARESGISTVSIVRFEGGKAPLKPVTVAAIRGVFEAAGIVFISDRRGEGIWVPYADQG
jgi:hypothetical protein